MTSVAISFEYFKKCIDELLLKVEKISDKYDIIFLSSTKPDEVRSFLDTYDIPYDYINDNRSGDVPNGPTVSDCKPFADYYFGKFIPFDENWDEVVEEVINRIDYGTVAVDFDGTIVEFNGWNGLKNYGDVKNGAREGIKRLKREGYKVMVYTTRNSRPTVKKAMDEYGIPFDCVNGGKNHNGLKPHFDICIDDKGIESLDELS